MKRTWRPSWDRKTKMKRMIKIETRDDEGGSGAAFPGLAGKIPG